MLNTLHILALGTRVYCLDVGPMEWWEVNSWLLDRLLKIQLTGFAEELDVGIWGKGVRNNSRNFALVNLVDFWGHFQNGEDLEGIIHISGIHYILIIVQLSLPCISKMFSSCRTETLNKTTTLHSSLPPACGNHHPLFCLDEFDYSRDFILVDSYRICPFWLAYFT